VEVLLQVGLERADGDFAFLLPSFILFGRRQWILPMISLDQCGRMYIVSCFPCVICIGVALPLDKILKPLFTSEVTVINDGFDFIFLGVFDKVRRRPRVVSPVFCSFAIRGQEGRMEDIMDGPGSGEL
jgi:hypothetical protein